jgi:hypothetical protein
MSAISSSAVSSDWILLIWILLIFSALRMFTATYPHLACAQLKQMVAMYTSVLTSHDVSVATVASGYRQTSRALTRFDNFDFAVGFSRQPLPKGNRFAIVTNTDGPGIMATDAPIRCGLELAKLRPETLKPCKAKLPPTANVFPPGPPAGTFSMTECARAGCKKITNGVKQKLLGTRRLGMETFNQPHREVGARVANLRSAPNFPPSP